MYGKTKVKNRNIWLAYSWNKAKPYAFEWYIGQSFNSVEIIIPFTASDTQSIKFWESNTPKDFTFSIKVHRSITHYNKLKQPMSIQLWDQLSRIFQPFENEIDFFWLFQMLANFKFKPENLERVRYFFNSESIAHQIVNCEKAVIEFRDSSWWNGSA